MNKRIQYLTLDHFQKLGRSLKFQDCIFLDDNLESGGSIKMYDEVSEDHMVARFPYKLNFWAAFIDIEGQMISIINGQEYRLDRNDALIVPAGAIIESLTCTPDIKDIAMAFADNQEIMYSQKSTSMISAWLKRQAAPYKFRIEPERLKSYLNLYEGAKRLYMSAEPHHRDDIVKGLLQISTASFSTDMSSTISERQPSNRAEELYFEFMNDLQKYCTSQRKVGFYAEQCCVCTKYFTRQIKAASGKTPMQLIKERVIIEAKAMLNSDNDSIKRISEAMNFPNSAFFCRYFKQETGMSPTEFRNT